MHVYLSEASEMKKPREYLASILLTTKLFSTVIKQDAHEPEWNRRYQEKMQEMSTIIYSILIKGLFQPWVKYLFLQNFLMRHCRLSLHNTIAISM